MEEFDNRLVQRFNEGEEQAFSEVYKLYYRRLCYYAQRLSLGREDSEEVVSAVFVSLFQTVCRGKRFENEKHIRDFLFLSTRNASFNQVQYARRQSGYMKDFLQAAEKQEEEMRNQQIELEMMQMIYNAVENLPTECRRIFKMRYLQDRSYQEIAAELNLSPQTVRNQKSRAVMLLKKHLLKSETPELVSVSAVSLLLAFALFSGLN